MSEVLRCEARIHEVCPFDGLRRLTRHHRHKRVHGGNVLFGPFRSSGKRSAEYMIVRVCEVCHKYVHEHEAWAISWGLLVPPGVDPRSVEVYLRAVPGIPGPVQYSPEELLAGLQRLERAGVPLPVPVEPRLRKRARRAALKAAVASQALNQPWSPRKYGGM